MTIEEAIKVAVEINDWRRGEGSEMPHAPREFGEAIYELIEHARRTTWQPIETLTTNAEDVFLCRKNGIHVTNAVYISSDKEWVIVSRHPHNDTIHNPAEQYDFWMPAINPPKESK